MAAWKNGGLERNHVRKVIDAISWRKMWWKKCVIDSSNMRCNLEEVWSDEVWSTRSEASSPESQVKNNMLSTKWLSSISCLRIRRIVSKNRSEKEWFWGEKIESELIKRIWSRGWRRIKNSDRGANLDSVSGVGFGIMSTVDFREPYIAQLNLHIRTTYVQYTA